MKKILLIIPIALLFNVSVFSQNNQLSRNYLDSLFKHLELQGNLRDFSYPNVTKNIGGYLRSMDKNILLQKIRQEYRNTKDAEVFSYCTQFMRDILLK